MVTYLDASAWVKRYVDEDGSARMASMFSEDTTFACATVGFLETLTALGRAARSGRIDERSYRTSHARATTDFGRFIAIDLTPEVFSIARGMTDRFALDTGDVVHLASATALRGTHPDPVRIVTADRELAAAARLARFEVLDPTDA